MKFYLPAYIVVSLSIGAFSLGANTLYSIVDVGPALSVSGLNNNGQIAGFTPTASFYYDGSYHTIGNPTGGTFRAFGLNDSGQVVGQISYPSPSYAIGLYSGGTLQILGSNVSGLAINNAGQIAGDLPFAYEAMRYANGVITPIRPLPGDGESGARAINQSGDVLVYSTGSTGHAAIYSNGTLTQVPGSAGLNVQPAALNNVGQVVGSFSTSASIGPDQAILFSNGQAIPLGMLPGPGTQESFADSINDSGIVVGGTYGTSSRAMAYYPGTGLVDLNAVLVNGSGWALQIADQVNDAGQIAGIGTYNGVQSAFLLDPVATPEPASTGLLLIGFSALVYRAKRKRR